MEKNVLHYFVDTNSSRGFVSFWESNFGKLEKVVKLDGYPDLLVTQLVSQACAQALGCEQEVELIHNRIRDKQLFVLEENGTLHGAFAFIIGEDPTYLQIDDGSWLSDAPYGTIHQVASDGTIHGFFSQIVDYCWTQIPHLRVDTHTDNQIMQHLIQKNGFERRGIIYVLNHSPRIAFERVK